LSPPPSAQRTIPGLAERSRDRTPGGPDGPAAVLFQLIPRGHCLGLVRECIASGAVLLLFERLPHASGDFGVYRILRDAGVDQLSPRGGDLGDSDADDVLRGRYL
jgi:hypothetical protein